FSYISNVQKLRRSTVTLSTIRSPPAPYFDLSKSVDCVNSMVNSSRSQDLGRNFMWFPHTFGRVNCGGLYPIIPLTQPPIVTRRARSIPPRARFSKEGRMDEAARAT